MDVKFFRGLVYFFLSRAFFKMLKNQDSSYLLAYFLTNGLDMAHLGPSLD